LYGFHRHVRSFFYLNWYAFRVPRALPHVNAFRGPDVTEGRSSSRLVTIVSRYAFGKI
jgi:hypothetical protein